MASKLIERAKEPVLHDYYTWDQYPGVVFYPVRHPYFTVYDEWGDEVDSYPDVDNIFVCAVGDDRYEVVALDDLTPYDDEVCSCGQVGCGWAE